MLLISFSILSCRLDVLVLLPPLIDFDCKNDVYDGVCDGDVYCFHHPLRHSDSGDLGVFWILYLSRGHDVSSLHDRRQSFDRPTNRVHDQVAAV